MKTGYEPTDHGDQHADQPERERENDEQQEKDSFHCIFIISSEKCDIIHKF